jgi:methylated-DNA-[protein]-cysteine S-methyltransferase
MLTRTPLRQLYIDRIESPIGTILLIHDADGRVRALDFDDFEPRMRRLLRRHYGADGDDFVIADAAAPPAIRYGLSRYFAGDLTALDALPVATSGTAFQRDVWAALRKIPPGTTLSYGGLAEALGRPRSVRAVGLANGANPIGIIVPCHRVIGADGSLTGYGGGIERKRWLLTHERAAFRRP